MVIPASTKSNENIAPTGLRIGLSFTTPFIILLMTHSTTILGLIGHNYMGAGLELAILGLSILPASITIIAISEFNNTHQLRKILIIGITEIITFLISFSLIVPNTGILGAALATLIAFLISSILAVLWINRISIKYIINSIVSIVSGLILWIVLVLTLGDSETLNAITIVPILIVSTTIIFYLNKITLSEIKGMMHALYRKGELS
jgi:O-antigen/teichoic acid export membrane protein